MKTRLALILLALLVILAAAVVAACYDPAGPQTVTTRVQMETEEPSRGIGPILLPTETEEPGRDIRPLTDYPELTGDKVFDPYTLNAYAWFNGGWYDVFTSFGAEGRAAYIRPDYNWIVEEVRLYLYAVETPITDTMMYIYELDRPVDLVTPPTINDLGDLLDPIATAVITAANMAEYTYFVWPDLGPSYLPTFIPVFEFDPPITLNETKDYLFVIDSLDDEAVMDLNVNTTAYFSFHGVPPYPPSYEPTDPAWLPFKMYGCAALPVDPLYCVQSASALRPHLPIAFTLGPAVPTVTPTATPIPEPTDPPGILNCTIPTPMPIQTVVLSEAGGSSLPVDDTFLCQNLPTMNFGSISNLVLDPDCTTLIKWTGLNRYRGLTLTRATLRLFVLGDPVIDDAGAHFFTVFPVLKTTAGARTISWTELQSTWQARVPGVNWQTAGARGVTDIATTLPSGYFTTIAPGWIERDLWLPLVRDWIEVPQNNFGVAIMNADATLKSQIASSEWSEVEYRPQLVLTFN